MAYRQQESVDKYSKNGIYALNCLTYGKCYLGQIWRVIWARFKEHFVSYKYQNQNSRSVQHLQENHHLIGPLDSIMEVVQVDNKSSVMKILEKFCICKETQMNNQINDRSTTGHKILKMIVCQIYPRWRTDLPTASCS